MKWLTTKVRSFFREEDGVTAIEYGLIAALIAVVIIVAVATTGNSLNVIFTTVANYLTNAATP